MKSAVFEIDRTRKGGLALFELLQSSGYAKLVSNQNIQEYTFDDLNESSKKAFADADADRTYKTKNTKDLFEQLGI